MAIVAGIKGAFIYHLCFVVLSILHHRDKEQRTEMGRKTKKEIQLFQYADIVRLESAELAGLISGSLATDSTHETCILRETCTSCSHRTPVSCRPRAEERLWLHRVDRTQLRRCEWKCEFGFLNCGSRLSSGWI